MLALFVAILVHKAQEGIGWVPPSEPRSLVNALFEFILAGALPFEERTEVENRSAADLDALSPGLGTELLAEFAPNDRSRNDGIGVEGFGGRLGWHGCLGLGNGWAHAGQMPGTSTFRNRCGLTVAVSG